MAQATKASFLLFFFVFLNGLKGQEVIAEKKWSWSISAGYLSTKIKNENYEKDEALKTKNESNICGELHVLYPLSSSVYFLTGISYLKYSTLSESNGFFKALSMKQDIDGYSYFPLVESKFKDHRKITTISVPIALRKNFSRSIEQGCFSEFGLLANYVAIAEIKGEGSYETKGMYPDDNYSNVYIILEDIPRLDYKEIRKDKTTYISTNHITFNYFLSLGYYIMATDNTELSFKGYYTASIFDITEKADKKKDYIEIAGDSDPYKKTTLSGLGIILGLKF